MKRYQRLPYLEPSGKQVERKTEKQLEKISNQGSG
jgi:hypothetical protein